MTNFLSRCRAITDVGRASAWQWHPAARHLSVHRSGARALTCAVLAGSICAENLKDLALYAGCGVRRTGNAVAL